ncbi:MAG: retroviral-like aspartic protease family protein [Scytolyngbya sp. HA4215-MV1]|nr:retroviral-like aspartic protease family protein [Scytolyngbya sp. HA4215-MV1]
MNYASFRLLVCSSLIATVVTPLATVPWQNQAAIAQDTEGCEIVIGGRNVDTSKLCGTATPVKASRSYSIAPIKRRDGGSPVIDVTFNGNRKFEMIFDTGASITVINPRMAQALQVKPVKMGKFVMGDGAAVLLPIGYIRSVSIDGAVVQNVEVAIAENLSIGLLGQNFFGAYEIRIKQSVLELHRRQNG